MAFGASTINNIGGAVSDIFSSQASAGALKLKATGNLFEAQNYDRAEQLARQEEDFVKQSTAIKQVQSERHTYQGIGRETADIGGAGFAQSGSALDLLRDSARQGALSHQVIGQQGLITEAGYEEQAQSYNAMAYAARYAAAGETSAAHKTLTAGWISAGFHAAAAVGSLFTGGGGGGGGGQGITPGSEGADATSAMMMM